MAIGEVKVVPEDAVWKYDCRPKPHLCPVCQGRGTVEAGFYSRAGSLSDLTPEECKGCKGEGILWR